MATNVTMPFGKFAGVALTELPDQYVAWLLNLPDLREPLRQFVIEESIRRDRVRNAERAAALSHPGRCCGGARDH